MYEKARKKNLCQMDLLLVHGEFLHDFQWGILNITRLKPAKIQFSAKMLHCDTKLCG